MQYGDVSEATRVKLSVEPGSRIHQYEIIREIGEGGMGQVLLARDTKLGRLVAIKILNSSSAEQNQRFINEGRTTAQLTHENIIVIHEVGEISNTPFMVLEFLEGQTLRDLCKPGVSLSVGRVIELMIPIVRALVRAHASDVVHRDLKPENIMLTSSGQLKVLDFGLAKVLSTQDDAVAVARAESLEAARAEAGKDMKLTRAGVLMGTMPYMSPEQWGQGEIDFNTDIWAVGIMIFEMLNGAHPLRPVTPMRLMHHVGSLEVPMPSLATLPNMSAELVALVDCCLQKDKRLRFKNAEALLDALTRLVPGRSGRALEEGENPYPGLAAFQEEDADRFFGRARDVQRLLKKIRDRPLLGIVGPSGVGKSSLVRAGLLPALKASGEDWEAIIIRPGRDPLGSLASVLAPLTYSTSSTIEEKLAEHRLLAEQIRESAGFVGTLLRSRAQEEERHFVLYVDQFEELYTQVDDAETREAFIAALAGIADESSSPLRVIVTMRSDFLDRLAQSETFLDSLSQGMIFLLAPEEEGLRQALTQPVQMLGYDFESPSLVSRMLDSVTESHGALPVLQFAAARLWEHRDKNRRLLTEKSYEEMGGVEGALAAHADEVLSALPGEQEALAGALFKRLVTSEGTRAIVDLSELYELGNEIAVDRLVSSLVQARLLVVQTRGGGEGPTAEIVHESLITQWPRLRSWLDDNREDAVLLDQLRIAAKQWEQKDRPVGLLWHGDAEREAIRFRHRYHGHLLDREESFLDAVVALANQSTRRKRLRVIGVIAFLCALVVAGSIALVQQTRALDAEKSARLTQERAEAERKRAEADKLAAKNKGLAIGRQLTAAELKVLESERQSEEARLKALAAEERVQAQLESVERAEAEQLAAQRASEAARARLSEAERLEGEANQRAAWTKEELAAALRKAEKERSKTQKELTEAHRQADRESKKAQAANEKLQILLKKERQQNQRLKLEAQKIKTGRLE